jgi:hypothetical protein
MPSSNREVHPYGRSADDVRRRDDRQRRLHRVRVTQLLVFSLSIILIAGAVAFAVNHLRSPDEAADPAPTAALASDGTYCVGTDAVPTEPGEVTVSVRNGTGRQGLAASVSSDLEKRGYLPGKLGNTSDAKKPVTIVYAPEAYLQARSVAAQFTKPKLQVDTGRSGTTVEVLLGDDYDGLASE